MGALIYLSGWGCLKEAVVNCSSTGDLCQIPSEICDDELDNDSDGYVDCEDQDCQELESCLPKVETVCDDELDNDFDKLIDCDDEDCKEDQACVTEKEDICDDQIDNDLDKLIDCYDEDCE